MSCLLHRIVDKTEWSYRWESWNTRTDISSAKGSFVVPVVVLLFAPCHLGLWGSGLFSGYLCMTDDWFSEYVYEVVVDKKHVPEEVLTVLEQEPIVLPAWDPMGALAEWCCLQLFPPPMGPEVAAKDRSRDWSQSYIGDSCSCRKDTVRLLDFSSRNLFGKVCFMLKQTILKEKNRKIRSHYLPSSSPTAQDLLAF